MADETTTDGATPDADNGGGDAAESKAQAAAKAARKERDDAKRLASELQERLREFEQRDMTDTQRLAKAAERVPELESRATSAEARAMRAEVALEIGLPAALAKRLAGSTREELEADAAELMSLANVVRAEAAPPGPVPVLAGSFDGGSRGPAPRETDPAAALQNAMRRMAAGLPPQ
jgi:hypothetical protein